MAVGRVQRVIVHQHACQDYRAGHGNGHAKNQAGPPRPAQQARRDRSEAGGDEDLHQRARNGDVAHGHQIFHMEVQPDAKHEENDANFRGLGGKLMIGDKAGGERAHRHARQQIADNWRKLQLFRDITEYNGRRQRPGQRQYQIRTVLHFMHQTNLTLRRGVGYHTFVLRS